MRGAAANRTEGGFARCTSLRLANLGVAGLGLAGLGLAGLGLAMSFAMAGATADAEAEPKPPGPEQSRPMGLTREAGVEVEGAHVPPVKRVQPVTPPAEEPVVPLPVRRPESLTAGATGTAGTTNLAPGQTPATKKLKPGRQQPANKKPRRN